MKAAQHTPSKTSNLRTSFTRLAVALFLALGALAPTTAKAVAPGSGLPFTEVLSDAQHLAALNKDWSVYMVKGESMEPLFGSNSVLVVDHSDFSLLRPGMMVVYKDAAGDFVAHRLIEHTANGWTVMGQNNEKQDPGLVTSDNFHGVVFCMLHYKEGTDKLAANLTSQTQVAFAKRY